MVPKEGRRRTSTLSISLPHELAEAISERVRSGLYTSASELIREALRLLLRVEEAQRSQLERVAGAAVAGGLSSEAMRFATTMQLHDLGMAICEEKLRHAEGGLAEEAARDRLRRLKEQQEAGPGLRIAPERLAKLELRE